jgi:hypothetical protein
MSKTAKKIKVTQPRTKPAANATKGAGRETVRKAPPAAASAAAPEAIKVGRNALKPPPARTGDDSARMPPVGTVIKKLGRDGRARCECKVEKDGVRYDGKVYGSLSGAAIAAAKDLGLSGNSFNGFVFWGLAKPARVSTDPASRLDRLWARYQEAASALLKAAGAEKGPVLGAMKPHAAQLERILGSAAQA